MFGNSGQEEFHERIYLPITTAQHYLTGSRNIDYFALRLADGTDIAAAYEKVHETLLHEHRMIEDFQIENIAENIAEAIEGVERISRTWNTILGSIAAVSLLVGGIGLLSVLIISVNERLREIGIRKAVGASDADIFRQLLVESVTISLVRRDRRPRSGGRPLQAHRVRGGAGRAGLRHPGLRRRGRPRHLVRRRHRSRVRALPGRRRVAARPHRRDLEVRLMFEDLARDNRSGATALTRAAAERLLALAASSKAGDPGTFWDELTEACRELVGAQREMASIVNLAGRVLSAAERVVLSGLSPEVARQAVHVECTRAIECASEALASDSPGTGPRSSRTARSSRR